MPRRKKAPKPLVEGDVSGLDDRIGLSTWAGIQTAIDSLWRAHAEGALKRDQLAPALRIVEEARRSLVEKERADKLNARVIIPAGGRAEANKPKTGDPFGKLKLLK